jgi:hypothetical protein
MDMKAQFKVLAMACIMAAGTIAAAPAFAAHATPVSTTFIATGPTSLSFAGLGNIACNSTFTLVTDSSGNVTVTQAVFSAGNVLCPLIKANNLPWSVTLNSTTSATINNVNVGAGSAVCSGNASATIGSSSITLTGSVGSCGVSGTLNITPTFTVVP